MVDCVSNTVYSDELFTATELNRQSGHILDRALEHLVTITRNDQHFALLSREKMANYIKAVSNLSNTFAIMRAISQLRTGESIDSGHIYGWVRVFDAEELADLEKEIHSSARHCLDAGDWDLLNAVIHEWRESAIAIESSELTAAFNDEIDQVPLTQPAAA